LVGNHSGGTLIADTFAFAYAFYDHFGPDRLFFQLAHDLVFRVPGLLALRRYGTIPANHEYARAALGRGAALLVYPGGDYETYRPSWHSGEIDFGHRTGFVRLALEADVPIVPVVAVGGQETALFLTRGERLARRLGLHRLLRVDVVPIQIAPPFGVTVLDLPGRIPLPSQITIQVLPKIDLRRRFGPDPDVEAVYHAVTAMMQEELDELSAERDLPVIGALGRRHEKSEVVDELVHGGLEREIEAAIEAEERDPRLVRRQGVPSGKRSDTTMKNRKSGSTGGNAGESPSQRIDARIVELSDWRGETLARIRDLIKEADPEVVEEWKWRGVPVWEHSGIICTGEMYKNYVKTTFAKGASLEDPSGLFNSSLEGNTRRAIDFHEGEEIDKEAFKALIRAAVALNTS
jgi:1-acyl-sn-glycerol-3-phosphate acyltransferase